MFSIVATWLAHLQRFSLFRTVEASAHCGSRSYGDGGKGLAPLSLCETDGGAP